MTDIGFTRKEVIPPGMRRMEVLDAEKNDTFDPQVALKLRVLGGEYDGHTFMDYSARDKDTGNVKEGGKAWSIFEACLGHGFDKKPDVSVKSLVGKQFMGQVTQTKTGSRNKVEFGTVGPVPPTEEDGATEPDGPSGDDDDMFADIPF